MSVDLSREGGVAVLTVNRPDALNAFDVDTLTALRDHLRELAEDSEARVVVVTGAGERAFAAGADIKYMSGLDVDGAKEWGNLGHEVGHLLETMPKPTIAAINGFALGGGCEVALACDFRYASSNAKLGQPEVTLGIIPGWGGTQRLARAVGIGLAKELILTGRVIDADEALRIELVNAVYEPGELMPKTLEVAQGLASKAPLALAAAKEAVNRALAGDHGDNLEREADYFGELFSSEDAKEGLIAFAEKREPRFTGVLQLGGGGEQDALGDQRAGLAHLRVRGGKRHFRPERDRLARLRAGEAYRNRCTTRPRALDQGAHRHRDRQPPSEVSERDAHRGAAQRPDVHPQLAVSCGHDLARQGEREDRSRGGVEEQPLRDPELRIGVDRRAAARVHLEMEVRADPVRVARVADESDRLTREHALPVLEASRKRDALNAVPTIVVRHREVVVQVDVEVLRAAVAVQVEHAAGAARARVEADLAGLGGERRRLARGHDVFTLVRALASRVAEAVRQLCATEHGEDDLLALDPGLGRLRGQPDERVGRFSRRGPRQEAKKGEQEKSSGCRPETSHKGRAAEVREASRRFRRSGFVIVKLESFPDEDRRLCETRSGCHGHEAHRPADEAA